jgi:hypothetical protein
MDSSKGHKFRSDRWNAIKLLLEFPDELFHGVDEELILDDDEVWSSQARSTVRKAITFNPTVGSRSKFYWSFRMPFSMQWMRDQYSVMMTSGRSRLHRRFERPEFSIRPLDRDQTFTGVSGCTFPWSG